MVGVSGDRAVDCARVAHAIGDLKEKTMHDGLSERSPRTGRIVGLAVGGGFLVGVAVAAVYWRQAIAALVARAKPYVRKQVTVKSPALIINRWSGDGKAERYGLADEAEKAGATVIMLERGDDLVQLAHDAISAGADAIGMAGGDGSLGLVAGVAVERGVPFFCVPVGTRNHFALDLGLDRDDPLSALAALRGGEEILIDIAMANRRPFINNVSFGVYAQAVHQEQYRGEKLATLTDTVAKAAVDVDAQAPLRFVTPDGRKHDRAPLLIVSSNRYTYSGYPDYGRRERMDGGRLGIGAITSLPEGDLKTMRLDQIRSLQEWDATSYRIESDEKILAGLDGEAVEFDSPLNLTIRPQGLRVLVPEGTVPGYVPAGEAAAARLLDLAETTGVGDK